MSEFKESTNYLDQIHAPASLYTEVWNMTIEKETKQARHYCRPALILAAAVVLLLAVSLTAYAMGPSLFGWGGNFEVRRDEQGETMEAVLHTDLSVPEKIVGIIACVHPAQ